VSAGADVAEVRAFLADLLGWDARARFDARLPFTLQQRAAQLRADLDGQAHLAGLALAAAAEPASATVSAYGEAWGPTVGPATVAQARQALRGLVEESQGYPDDAPATQLAGRVGALAAGLGVPAVADGYRALAVRLADRIDAIVDVLTGPAPTLAKVAGVIRQIDGSYERRVPERPSAGRRA
jgi:hypothetical protein